jgi:hypothetical protein
MSTCSAPVFALRGSSALQVAMILSQPSWVLISARHGAALMLYARESSAASFWAGTSDASVT